MSASALVRPSHVNGEVVLPKRKKEKRPPIFCPRPGTAGYLNWSRESRDSRTLYGGENRFTQSRTKVMHKRHRAQARNWFSAEAVRNRSAAQEEYDAVLQNVRALEEKKSFA